MRDGAFVSGACALSSVAGEGSSESVGSVSDTYWDALPSENN